MKDTEIAAIGPDKADGGLKLLGPRACAIRDRCPMIIGWAAMLIFTFHACTHMVAAGDTWVAMACGRHFVNHGVDTVEPFSANSHHAGPTAEEIEKWPGWAKWITDKVGVETVKKWHPTGWVNQNWLTHVIFYRLSTMFGSEDDPCFNALIIWKFGVYFLSLLCLYATARIYGVNHLLAAAFCCFAMFIGRSFMDVRPAGFSNLLVAAFILVLALASYRNALYVWLIVPLVVFWSNVHGGYLYAFIVLVPFVGWHLMMRLPRRWTICIYSVMTWLVVYGMANRFQSGLYTLGKRYLGPDYFKPVQFGKDPIVVVLILAVLAIVGLTVAWSFVVPLYRKTIETLLAVVGAGVSGILFLSLLFGRFYPTIPPDRLRIPDKMESLLDNYVSSGRLDYMGIFLFALILAALLVFLKPRAVRVMEYRGIWHTMGAGAVALVAMIVFNPFHLTNLTHTFVISVSEHAQRWRDVHEWHRAFAWDNPVGTAIPFLVMCIIAWIGLITWLVVSIQTAKEDERKTGPRPWPKIDLALFVIAALTIYMAIRSRRFIPIAAFAACPVLALMIQEIVASILTVTSLRRRQAAPASLAKTTAHVSLMGLSGAVVLLLLWGLLFWRWLFYNVTGGTALGESHSALVAFFQWLFVGVFNQPTLVRPQLALTVLGVALAFAVVMAPAVLYFILKRPKDDGAAGPGRDAIIDWAGRIAPIVLACLVTVAGIAVGLRFKRIYLDYWPADPDRTSIFMRMTASDAKPFDACQFIRENKLSGHMFNYWTEGGFIAWGQDPDPETGKTPLQLFMDGRAQAAYNRRTFDLWTTLMAGGSIGQNIDRRVEAEERQPTASEYAQVGKWMSEQFDKYKVWVVLMPAGQFDKVMVRGLEHAPEWRIAFMNNRQKLLVNITTEQGKRLYEGMFNGQTKYPDDFSKNLSVGQNLMQSRDPALRKQGLDMVNLAFELNPSPQPMLQFLLEAAPKPELRGRVDEICAQYVKKFQEAKKEGYEGRDGYNYRLESARLALFQVQQIMAARGDSEAATASARQRDSYLAERDEISARKRW